MENEVAELPREEALARLYELRNQLDVFDALRLASCQPIADGRCSDCARHGPRLRYISVRVCERCAMQRIRVASFLDAR